MTRKTKNRLIAIILTTFLILVILWTSGVKGSILNIQGYFYMWIPLFILWVFFAEIFLFVLKSDTGFFKLISMLGIILAIVILIINPVIDDTDFQSLKNEDQKVVLEIIDQPTYYQIRVYNRQNFLFSKYIDEVKVDKYYEYTYYIEDDEFVVKRCGVSSCTYLTVPLE
jgi:hypothetical protein